MEIAGILLVIWVTTYFLSRLASYAEQTKIDQAEARQKADQRRRINALYGRDE